MGFGIYAVADLLAFDPLLEVLAAHVFPRQLEQCLVVFGLQALAASALQRAGGWLYDTPSFRRLPGRRLRSPSGLYR